MSAERAATLYTPSLVRALEEYASEDGDQRVAARVESEYWNSVAESAAATIRDGGSFEAYLETFALELNFGLFAHITGDTPALASTILAPPATPSHLHILLVTDYLRNILHTTTGGDRREVISNEIRMARHQAQRIEDEIAQIRKGRREALLEAVSASSLGEPEGLRVAKSLEDADRLLLKSSGVKKSIAQGVFIPIEERREHVKREKVLDDSRDRTESFLAGLKDKEGATKVRELNRRIQECIRKHTDACADVEKLQENEKKLSAEQEKLSPLEVENHLRNEITYLRDLVKLSAKRLQMPSRPFIRNDDHCVTLDSLHAAVAHILEFDPGILRNDRVNLFGPPSVLLAPGYGKALYDWKHNQIVVPILPHQGNPLASVATGAIEYRLDVDEDKKLLGSYNDIPEYRKVRSLFQLKAALYKDYLTWMTSEYQGYRVLPSTTRKWFDHEIAPNRNEIFTPPHLHPWVLTSSEVRTQLEALEKRLDPLEKALPEDRWTASILFFQQGDYARCRELLTPLATQDLVTPFVHYNLGIALSREMRKQQAVESFRTFTQRQGQSWWSNLARDHIRLLQQR